MSDMILGLVEKIIPYSGFVLAGIFISLFIVAFTVIRHIFIKASKAFSEVEKINKENLKNINIKKVPTERHGEIIRTAISPDGIDPNTLSYMTIFDGGRERFVRTFTIKEKPKRTVFGKTFNSLFDFSGCTSSVFIIPKSEDEMSKKFSRNITVLESEYMRSSGDPNRQRRLAAQTREVSEWASEIESGENSFFEVGFLFSIYADSLQDLNKLSDSFYAEALSKGIVISGCYGLQTESYALNGPFNGHVQIKSESVKHTPILYMTMDKYSVSTLINYLHSSFTHKTGIPLGRDLFTRNPVVFNLFDRSHDSMSLAIAGKPGSGKSLLIKIMAARQILFGWHYVAIDSQVKKGTSEGEYGALAVASGGVNFKLMNHTSECLNLFDIGETIRSEITGDTYKETRTVDIAGKVATLTNNLCSIILSSADRSFDSVSDQTYVKRILTDVALSTYSDFGIVDGDVDSLYEEGPVGEMKKKLPTLSDFYKRVLVSARDNTENTLKKAYNLIIYGLKDYIKELIYTKDSLKFLTKEEFDELPEDEAGKKYYVAPKGKAKEEVIFIRGVRAYYDGQSTINVNRDCPFVNFDISMLPDVDKKLARQVCMSWVTENFIKKNSERLDPDKKLVVILDEVHECYKDSFARDTVDITVREARKRYVGIILATQTLAEYDNYPETQAILKLVECKMIFRQDYQDRDYLIESLGITPSQADNIVGFIGGGDIGEDRASRRGEMCIIDGKNVCFCKVDYLRATEELIADTDAASVAERFKDIYAS